MEPRRCCNREAKYKILYDWPPEPEEVILCSYHYGLSDAFKRNIKKIEELN